MMKFKQNRWSLAVIWASVSFLLFTVFWAADWNDEKKVIHSDATYYYSYLPAFFIHNDPDFHFAQSNPEKYGNKIYLEINEKGRNNIRTTMGVAYFYAPFFFIAHFFAVILQEESDGYSWIYMLAIVLAGVFYLCVGLLFLRKILLLYFSDKITAIGLLLIVFASNLFYYSVFENAMSHVYSFFMLSVFMYFSIKWYSNPSIKRTFSLGLIFGLIVLIRPSNILFAIIPLLFGIKSKNDFVNRFHFLKNNWKLIFILSFAALLPWLPQMIYWYYVSGNLIHYSYPAEARFYFSNPHLIEGLFSYRKGWFLYTPLMLLAVLSIPLLKKYAADWFFAVLVFVMVNTYVILSWPIWWYGGGFGQRAFIDSYPLMLIAIGAFIQFISTQKKFIQITCSFILCCAIGLNLFQTRQYRSYAIHWDSMSKEAYWANFGKMKPVDGLDTLLITPDYDNAWKNLPEKNQREVR